MDPTTNSMKVPARHRTRFLALCALDCGACNSFELRRVGARDIWEKWSLDPRTSVMGEMSHA
jgi:hypothetical protein